MSAKYGKFKTEFSSELATSKKIEIMTIEGSQIIQDIDDQIEKKSDSLVIWSIGKTKKLVQIFDEHIVGFKLR